VIEEDEPQRQPTAGIQSQVAAISLHSKGSDFGSPRQMLGHA